MGLAPFGSPSFLLCEQRRKEAKEEKLFAAKRCFAFRIFR
jgi:hypothetical protein